MRHDHGTPYSPAHMNLVADRARYAISTRGTRQAVLMAAVNARIDQLIPGAPTFTQTTFSRAVAGKRPLKDYELMALAHALDVTLDWLTGNEPIEALDHEIWATE